MKKIFLMAMSAVLACVACDKDNYNYGGLEEGYGVISFADAGFIISEEVETRANAASNNTYIWVLKKGETENEIVDLNPNSEDDYVTYSSVKEKGITLPGGNYILRAQTGDTIEAGENTDVYGDEEDFTIIAGDTTRLGELTLTLYKQVKVKVYYNPTFQNSLVDRKVTAKVSLKNPADQVTNEVTFIGVNADSQYLPLELTAKTSNGVIMDIEVVAEMKVKTPGGAEEVKPQKMVAAISGVKPRQFREININQEEIEDGGANFTIVVDGLKVDTELTTDVEASEESLGTDPNAPKGDGGINLLNDSGLTMDAQRAWNAYIEQSTADIAGNSVKGVHKSAINVKGLSELTFHAYAPNKVFDFYVDIISTNTDFNEAVKAITVKNDGRIYLTKKDAAHRAVVSSLNLLGIEFPFSEDVIDKESVEFPLTAAIEALTEFAGTHYFVMNVRDKSGCTNTIVLTLVVE